MSGAPEIPRLGTTSVAILESLHQHRLLSTDQLHALHTPESSQRFIQQILARLREAGLASSVRLPGGLGVWHLSDRGLEAVEAIPDRAETRHKPIPPEHAAGPLQAHTLAVNEVGIAFVAAARERGDECGPTAWRHEIAHPLGPPPGRRRSEQLIADAVLTYQLTAARKTSLHYRFIELDRANRSSADLAAKLGRYARLYRHTVTTGRRKPVLFWTQLYPVFPTVLLVLAGRPRPVLQRRRKAVLALSGENPDLLDTPEVEISVCLLGDLIAEGPFAAIFHTATEPEKAVNWLGEVRS